MNRRSFLTSAASIGALTALSGCTGFGVSEDGGINFEPPLPPLQGRVIQLTLALPSAQLWGGELEPLMTISDDGVELHRDSLQPYLSREQPNLPTNNTALVSELERISNVRELRYLATVDHIGAHGPLIEQGETTPEEPSRSARQYRVTPSVAEQLIVRDRIEFTTSLFVEPARILGVTTLIRRGKIAEISGTAADTPTVTISQRIGEWELSQRYTVAAEQLHQIDVSDTTFFSVGKGDENSAVPHITSFTPDPNGSS